MTHAEGESHVEARHRRHHRHEPGTSAFEIMVPHDQPDTLMLYELYASKEASDIHWNGPSMQPARKATAGLLVSLKGVRCDAVE